MVFPFLRPRKRAKGYRYHCIGQMLSGGTSLRLYSFRRPGRPDWMLSPLALGLLATGPPSHSVTTAPELTRYVPSAAPGSAPTGLSSS
jgi:hypothetical protein